MTQLKFKRRQIDRLLAQDSDAEPSSRRISGGRVLVVGPELIILIMGTGQVWKEAALP